MSILREINLDLELDGILRINVSSKEKFVSL